MLSMQGKNVVIFGVANKRSIAWAIAQRLSDAGAKLAITYQNERLKAEAHDLITSLPGAKAFQCDVSSDAESDAFYAQLKYIHDHSEPKNPVYGIIRQDDDFGQEVEAGYERAVKEFGVKDGIRLRFKKGSSNFAAEMAQMKQAGVNVLANGGIFAGAANILSEARKLDMDIQSADVWSEGIPASAKLAAPAGYDYLVGDYVALTGPAVEKFLAMAKQFTTPEELAGVSRYTFVTYVGLKSLAHAMQECGKDLTRACTIEKLRQTKNLDTGGLSAPVSFDNPQQLAGTEVAVYQLNAKELKFHELVGFKKY